MDIFTMYITTHWLLMLLGATIIGLGKAGLKGVDMLAITFSLHLPLSSASYRRFWAFMPTFAIFFEWICPRFTSYKCTF